MIFFYFQNKIEKTHFIVTNTQLKLFMRKSPRVESRHLEIIITLGVWKAMARSNAIESIAESHGKSKWSKQFNEQDTFKRHNNYNLNTFRNTENSIWKSAETIQFQWKAIQIHLKSIYLYHTERHTHIQTLKFK